MVTIQDRRKCRNMKIGNHNFDWENGGAYVMGILNVTPDSFSDGSKFNSVDKAIDHAAEMIRDGAAIVDVGGESTRPGYKMITCDEEIERVCPVIDRIKKEFDVPISIDTYKASVAKAAIESGADMVNDIYGLKYDNIADVVASTNSAICIMHNRNNSVYGNNSINDFMIGVMADLEESIRIGKLAGIKDDKIIIDPGVGFAKDYEKNLWITNNVDKLKSFGYPVLLATSRKSMIGTALNLEVNEREEGTIATTVMAVMKGVAFVRVHDVEKNMRAIKMTRTIIESGEWNE